jgi:hypothetical protein
MAITVGLLVNGIISGLLAAVAMSVFMMFLNVVGLKSPLDMPLRLGKMVAQQWFGNTNMPEQKIRRLGMLMHLKIGSFFGLLYTLFLGAGWLDFLGSNIAIRGALYALLPWTVMQLVALPKMGAGTFGMQVSKKVPVATLILHVVYGVVLSSVAMLVPLA